ncbi:MAG: hypothetical protein IKC03_01835, partial [Oscillospiraceae bacterium]|nr:hypothetical protein [Oscillospiraceae bacterium]
MKKEFHKHRIFHERCLGQENTIFAGLPIDQVEKLILEQKMSALEGGFETKKWQKKASERGYEVSALTGA